MSSLRLVFLSSFFSLWLSFSFHGCFQIKKWWTTTPTSIGYRVQLLTFLNMPFLKEEEKSCLIIMLNATQCTHNRSLKLRWLLSFFFKFILNLRASWIVSPQSISRCFLMRQALETRLNRVKLVTRLFSSDGESYVLMPTRVISSTCHSSTLSF